MVFLLVRPEVIRGIVSSSLVPEDQELRVGCLPRTIRVVGKIGVGTGQIRTKDAHSGPKKVL